MPHLLFNLRYVPEDEAEEVRELLQRHGIAFYETPPNRWGISAGGIWLPDGEDPARAHALLDGYQHERAQRLHPPPPPKPPLVILAYLAVIALILYFSLVPFFSFGGS